MIRPKKSERIKYHVDYAFDNDFSAYARLLQSKWREEKGYPIDTVRKYGNFIDLAFARETKANFLTDNIRKLVTLEIAEGKKEKALISEPRIWNNLLSSQPLCFNLFGELKLNYDLATHLFSNLFPDRIGQVTEIKFEYSPCRGNASYTDDHSAFDVFVEYSQNNRRGFMGIEVKYAESLREESKEKAEKNFKERYIELYNQSGKFKPNSIDQLKLPPLSQIWRDHLLAIATEKDYDEGCFLFIYPSNNSYCHQGVNEYKALLNTDNEKISGFYSRYLEDFVFALKEISNAEWIVEHEKRYLGNELL